MTDKKLLEKFNDAVIKLWLDEQAEYADTNRESADYARKQLRKLREKVLKRMNKEK